MEAARVSSPTCEVNAGVLKCWVGKSDHYLPAMFPHVNFSDPWTPSWDDLGDVFYPNLGRMNCELVSVIPRAPVHLQGFLTAVAVHSEDPRDICTTYRTCSTCSTPFT